MTAQPPVLLVANVTSASGLGAVLGDAIGRGASNSELYINLRLTGGEDMGSMTAAADSWGVSSCSLPVYHSTLILGCS